MNPISLVIKVIDQASDRLQAIAKQAGEMGRSIREASQKGSDALMGMVGKGQELFGQLGQVAFGFNNILMAVQTLGQGSGAVFDLLVGQNERLNQSVLQAQASLVSTSRIFKDGIEIKNTTEAIQSLAPKMREALDTIAQDSLNLVGVTSGQLTEVFNTLLQNSNNLANQSVKGLSDSVSAATKLTSDFAAALGVILGGDLSQASQEISSIFQGAIGSDSVIAKSLGLTNEMVNAWKNQGVLVDKLREKLEPYLAGNALAAKSIEGISSNITEIIEITGRKAGVPLFEAWVEVLDKIYKYLARNQEAIGQAVSGAIAIVLDAGEEIATALSPTIQNLKSTIESAGPLVSRLFTLLVQGAVTAVQVLGPVVNTLTAIIAKSVEGYEKLSQLVFFKQIGDADEAIEELGRQTDVMSDSALNLAQKYKALNDIRKQGKPLTEEQLKAEKQLQTSARINAEQIDQQIAQLKSVTTFSEGQQNAINAQIAQLERMKQTLGNVGAIKGVEILSKQVPEIGTAFEQMAKKASSAMEAIAKAEGDPAQYAAKAQELMELTEQQLKLGQITEEEATKRYQSIATNTKLEASVQIAAQEALTALYQSEGEDRVKEIQDQQNKIQTLMKTDNLSRAAGEQQLTKLKQEQLKTQLEAVKKQIEEEDKLRKSQLQKQLTAIASQIAASEKAIADKQGKGQEVSEAEKKAVSDLKATEKGLKAQMDMRSQKAQDLERQEKQLQNQLSESQAEAEKQRLQERLKDYQEQANVNKAALDQKIISEEQYADLSITNARKETTEKLKQIEDRRAKLGKKDKEGLEALLVEEQQVKAEQFKKEEQYLRDRLNARLSYYDNLTKIEQSKLNQGLISQSEFSKKSLEVAKKRAEEELKQVEEERKRLPKGSTEALQNLAAKEAEIKGNLAKQERDLLQQQYQSRLEHYDRLTALEKAKLDSQTITQEEFARKSLEITRKRGEEELKQIAAERAKLPSGATDQLEKLAVREAEVKANIIKQDREFIQQQYQLRLEHYDRLNTVEQSKLNQGLITQEDFARKSLEIARRRGAEELKQIEEERRRTPSNNVAAMEKLAAREAEIKGNLAKQEREILQQQMQARLEHYDRLTALEKAKLDSQTITQEEFARKSLEITRRRGEEELKQIAAERAKLPAGATDQLEKLAVREAEAKANIIKQEREFIQQQYQLRLEHYDRLSTIEQSKLNQGLITQEDFARKSLEIARRRGAEELKQIEEERRRTPSSNIAAIEKLAAREAEIKGNLAKQERDLQEQISQARLKEYENRQTQLESSYAQQNITEQEFNARSLEISQSRIDEEIRQAKERATRLPEAAKAEREQITAQVAKLEADRYKLVQDYEAKIRDEILKGFQFRQSELDSLRDRDLVSESDYHRRSLELTKQRIAEELKQNQALQDQLPEGDKRRQELAVRRSQLLADEAKAEKQYREQVSQQRLQDFDEQRTILEASYAERAISEQEFNRRSLEITKQRIAEEQAQLDERASRLVAGDKEGFEKIDAERAKLRQQSAQASRDFEAKERDRVVANIEKQQRQASEAIAESEKNRELELERLIAAGLVTREAAQQEQLKFTRDRITQELALEERKLAQLKALPPSSDPKEEEARQSQIRAARVKTTQLTIDLTKNEQDQRQAAVAALKREIDLRMEAINNQTAIATQAWEKEIRLIDDAAKELGNYTKLMDARNGLQDSLNNMVQAELGVLEQLATDEKDKANIKELAARLEYEALVQKQAIERENTELSIQQTDQARERAKLENEIAKAKQQAAIAQAQADVMGVEADTTLDPRAKALRLQAAQAKLSAEITTGQALVKVDDQLARQEVIDTQMAQIRRNEQRANQGAALVSGQARFVGAIADEGTRTQMSNQLQGQILQQLGLGSLKNLPGINAGSRSLSPYTRSSYQDTGLRLDAGTAYQDSSAIKKEKVQSAIASNVKMAQFPTKAIADGTISLPQQQVKIPMQSAQSGAVDPKLLSVMEEIKTMVGKINAPVVNQKFEQVNHLVKGDAEGEKMAKQLDRQVRQGMDRFITELKRVK